MSLKELRITYQTDLATIYPRSEIESIFQLLVKHRLNLNRTDIVLEGDKSLNKSDVTYFQMCLERLKMNEPVQYIIGYTTFYDLTFKVTPDVLIPRPETEELVQWIVETINIKKPRILDIGTGSGCIAISLVKNLRNSVVSAIDISEKALAVARQNAIKNRVDVQCIQKDILTAAELPDTYDIIVSNPPYVRESEKNEMRKNVLRYEPEKALFISDNSPLVFYDKIVELAIKHLSKNGILFFEVNQYLGDDVVELLKQKSFTDVQLKKDFRGNNRVIRASI